MTKLLRRTRDKGFLRLARLFADSLRAQGWKATLARTRRFIANEAPSGPLPPTFQEPIRHVAADEPPIVEAASQRVADGAEGAVDTLETWRRFVETPRPSRQRILAPILRLGETRRGVILYPASSVPERGGRAERLLAGLAEAGFLCIVAPVDGSEPPVDFRRSHLVVANAFPDVLAAFAGEPVVLLLDDPLLACLTQFLSKALVVYDRHAAVHAHAGEERDGTQDAALRRSAHAVIDEALDDAIAARDAVAPIVSAIDEFYRPGVPRVEVAPTRRTDIVTFSFFDGDGDKVFNGGAERYVHDLALLCRRLGLAPRILQSARTPFERSFEGVPVLGIPLGTSPDLGRMSSAYQLHVADASLVIASPVELAARLVIDAPIVGINHGVHWDYDTGERNDHALERHRTLFDALAVVSRCVCVDTNFINWVRCYDWKLAQDLDYVPNYVDLDLFTPKSKDFDAETLTVLYPRRLYRARGFETTLEAAQALFDRNVPIRLALCGAASAHEASLAQAFITRHAGRVTWEELDIKDMHAAYDTSHIVLIPTNYSEGTSLSCIEAMATRNGVIATNVGGLPNLVIDGHNGVLVAPRAEDLAAAIERLAGDRQLLRTLAERALGVAAAFSKERWLRRWHETIHRSLPALVAAPSARSDEAR